MLVVDVEALVAAGKTGAIRYFESARAFFPVHF
jgi:hypothetical protein